MSTPTFTLPLLQVQELLLEHYGLKAEVSPLAGYADLNYKVTTNSGQQWVFKISAPDEDAATLKMQAQLLEHLARKETGLALPRFRATLRDEYLVPLETEEGLRYLRLLSWVPGRLMADIAPHSAALIKELGESLGKITTALLHFDHPATRRYDDWDVSRISWTREHFHLLPQHQQQLVSGFYEYYQQTVSPLADQLPQSVVYNDANDYNILLRERGDTYGLHGLIDFGDVIHTHTVNDLAIAAAYAGMHKTDPLASICELVKGYHRSYKLRESELKALFPSIAGRLIITLVKAAIGRKEQPENEYLQVSARPALELLEKLRSITPAFAEYSFRAACGLEACPKAKRFREWLAKQAGFASLLPDEVCKQPVHVFDLSVGSLELGNNPNFEDDDIFEKYIDRIMFDKKVEVGIGKYNEIRPLYTTDEYIIEGNEGPQWRSLHLGLDLFAVAGTAIHAPLAGKVFSVQDNRGDRNYGPTLILEHQMEEEECFYTLYGHLGAEVLSAWRPGDPVKQGDVIASIGPRPVNGNWPPHLHFQIILDLLDQQGDFPGVAFAHQAGIWTSICPDPNLLIGLPERPLRAEKISPADLLERRKAHLPANLSLSYRQPLLMLRAYRQYFYDHQGRRYLDLVNNVPHVGHQHPRVVAAASRQQAVLNTNTRYLHENVLAYSEALAAKFPEPLDVCFFVNSGSEANELAIRLARAWSGRQDLLVLENGYHGNTNICVEMSSYKFDGPGGRGAAPHIHKLPMPDPFRGKYRSGDPEAGRKYAADADLLIAALSAKGRAPAAVIAEPILSCGGQVVPPPGYFRSLYQKARASGGLCIADEVQTGFGRVGRHFWAFELQGVVPDIVTLGKPIGNGHPIGAVVTTREIAAAFANGMEFFNTFGGNPVSCAVGLEVMRIIEEEGLQQNALERGQQIKTGLKALQTRYPIIGDVRGEGLFLGVELVDKDRQPLPRQATYLVNRLKEHAILLSTDGPDHNVIKIKPPLCIEEQNVEFLLDSMEKILSESRMNF